MKERYISTHFFYFQEDIPISVKKKYDKNAGSCPLMVLSV